MKNKFAVFILSHGRPNNVWTYKLLRNSGYTGEIYIILDDTDKKIDEYKKNFDNVIVFSKEEIAKKFDCGDNFNDKAAVVYARNASFEIAKNLELDYFMEYDDDYKTAHFRLYKYGTPKPIKNLDNLFSALVEFAEVSQAHDLSIAQGGDFIGGSGNENAVNPTLKRKCMNTHILSTKRPFNFIGKLNEDVQTPVFLGSIGYRFFTVPLLSIEQAATQTNQGGLTDIYLDRGTYIKSFYSVMYSPSCVKVSMMGESHKRLHHKVNWNCAVPKILSSELKK